MRIVGDAYTLNVLLVLDFALASGINYVRRVVPQFWLSPPDESRVVIYNCNMFIIQATGTNVSASLRYAPASPTNIRLGWKGLPGPNALAYYEKS